jgi:hypothetical protein
MFTRCRAVVFDRVLMVLIIAEIAATLRAVLVIGFAAAIFMIRYSARHAAPTGGGDGDP